MHIRILNLVLHVSFTFDAAAVLHLQLYPGRSSIYMYIFKRYGTVQYHGMLLNLVKLWSVGAAPHAHFKRNR